MPNHVTTQLFAAPNVLDSLQGPSGLMDFETLVPVPPNIETGHCSGDHAPGVVCWYDWKRENWGTKWNAYRAERISVNVLQFESAWSHPDPVVTALSRKFPDAVIGVKYADEDLGHNLGAYIVKNGVVVLRRSFVEGSDMANNFAAQLVHGTTYKEATE